MQGVVAGLGLLLELLLEQPTASDAAGTAGVTPLEVIVDTVADVNRASPSDTTDPLQPTDYANIANELNEFMTDPQRGLDQFYTIVRNATE